MRKALFAAALLWSSCCFAARPPAPGYRCSRPPCTPIIDGEVAGDPAWQAIPSVTGFRRLGGDYTEAKQTAAQACWDDQAMYVAMTCEEPDAKELKPTMTDGGPTWLDDSVEVFLRPMPQGRTFQFGVTCAGAKGSGENNPDITKCQAAAKIGATSYSLELRIPFEVLDAKPEPGAKWFGTFCRNIFTTTSGGDKFTNWAPLETRFLEPEHFLPIVFEAKALDAAAAASLTEQLNAPYRAALIRRLQEAATQADEHVAALSEAAKAPGFARRASALLRDWRRLQHVNRDAAQAPLPAIRQSIAGVTGLVTASYRLKYEYLIAKLFEGE